MAGRIRPILLALSFIGAAVLEPLSEVTRVYLQNVGGGGRAVDLLIYGALIILISVFQPGGIIGIYNNWRQRRRSRRTPAGLARAPQQAPSEIH